MSVEFTASSDRVTFLKKVAHGAGLIYGFKNDQVPPQFAVVYAQENSHDGSATASASGPFSEWQYKAHSSTESDDVVAAQISVAAEIEVVFDRVPPYTVLIKEVRISSEYPGGVDRLAVGLAEVVLFKPAQE